MGGDVMLFGLAAFVEVMSVFCACNTCDGD